MRQHRDPTLRGLYLTEALAEIPRLLGAIDRNRFRTTYGCLDREFWHYRTSSFPSEMYQEGVLPLALLFATELPGNRWKGNARVRELAVAGIRYAARSSHSDGSCDDYYPFERALGAAVFSLQASTRAYQLLELDEPDLVQWFRCRADWIARHDESGHLSNHHALAALGLYRVAQITGEMRFHQAAQTRIDRVLSWQSAEGWFDEYGGADPGYQTVTIDCLGKYRRLSDDRRLDEPLGRALDFCDLFLHPDRSYGGEYGSRGTYHFYPHGMELLADDFPIAARLAEGFLTSLQNGRNAHFRDDRMYAHRLGNLIEAYLDWSEHSAFTEPPDEPSIHYLPQAGMLVRRDGPTHTVISSARGGVFKHFASDQPPMTDAGLIVETTDGRIAVSQSHHLDRAIETFGDERLDGLEVEDPMDWARFETIGPWKQAILQLGMCSVGRWCRTLVRRLLQRRLITGQSEAPIRFSRRFELLTKGPKRLRVTDTIRLTRPRLRIRRMAFGTDHQSSYVAASGVYQESVLMPWTDLDEHLDQLNSERCVVIRREF